MQHHKRSVFEYHFISYPVNSLSVRSFPTKSNILFSCPLGDYSKVPTDTAVVHVGNAGKSSPDVNHIIDMSDHYCVRWKRPTNWQDKWAALAWQEDGGLVIRSNMSFESVITQLSAFFCICFGRGAESATNWWWRTYSIESWQTIPTRTSLGWLATQAQKTNESAWIRRKGATATNGPFLRLYASMILNSNESQEYRNSAVGRGIMLCHLMCTLIPVNPGLMFWAVVK